MVALALPPPPHDGAPSLAEPQRATKRTARRHVRRRDPAPDVTEHGLRAGDIGTVVERLIMAGVAEESYCVEYFDMTGNTVGVVTLPAIAPRVPTPTDRRAVRGLSA